MKALKVQDIAAPDSGDEWKSAAYPGPGIYRHSGQLWVVESTAVSGVADTDGALQRNIQNVEPQGPARSALEMSDVLKLLAVRQNPHLAFLDKDEE